MEHLVVDTHSRTARFPNSDVLALTPAWCWRAPRWIALTHHATQLNHPKFTPHNHHIKLQPSSPVSLTFPRLHEHEPEPDTADLL